MPKFTPGESILIRCEVQRGAFPHEMLVTFETADGPISGFVRSDSVKNIQDHEGFIPAIVKSVTADTVAVVVRGSFFTTTGLAYLKRDWADLHVQPARAVA